MRDLSKRIIILSLFVASNLDAQTDPTNPAGPFINAQPPRPPGFTVISNRWRTMLGIANFGGPPVPNLVAPPQQRPPPYLPPWLTGPDTNFTVMDTSNIVPHDVMEAWLLKQIDQGRLHLQQPNLDPQSRWMLERSLRQFQEEWSEHETQVKINHAFAEALRSNPRGAWSNLPDPITQAWSLGVARTKSELADPALDPYRRQALEGILTTYEKQLADHETTAQLWLDLRSAQASKNEEMVSAAEHRLADYLAARIGKPRGMSLDAVMEEYKKQSGHYHWYDSRAMIMAIMLVVFLVPPIVMLFFALKSRSAQHTE